MPGTTTEGAKLPEPGYAAGAWNNQGSFFAVPSGGTAPNVNFGFDVAAAPTQVCWQDIGNGQVRLFVQGSTDQLQAAANGMTFNDWFPAYFLPWGSGKIGRMALPAQGPAVANPVRAFFTAEMNGCSFVVGGSKKGPVVAHYNVSNPTGALTQDQKDQTQIDMLKQTLTPGGAIPNIGGKRVNALRWVPNTYAADNTTGAQIANNPVSPYVASAAELTTVSNTVHANLAGNNQKAIGGPANPTGIVSDLRVATMGVLDNGTRDWRFFYQRNFFTQTNFKDRLGRMGGLIKAVGKDNRQLQTEVRYYRIPGWDYTELWPNGPGTMRMPAHGNPLV